MPQRRKSARVRGIYTPHHRSSRRNNRTRRYDNNTRNEQLVLGYSSTHPPTRALHPSLLVGVVGVYTGNGGGGGGGGGDSTEMVTAAYQQRQHPPPSPSTIHTPHPTPPTPAHVDVDMAVHQLEPTQASVSSSIYVCICLPLHIWARAPSAFIHALRCGGVDAPHVISQMTCYHYMSQASTVSRYQSVL